MPEPTETPPQVAYPPPSWKSPDTYFHLVSALVSALVLSEVFMPGSIAAKMVQCIALALQYAGYNFARAQVRTAISLPPPSSGQAGFARLGAMMMIAALAIAVGCSWWRLSGKDEVRAGGAMVVDCGSKAAMDALKQYGPTVEAVFASATTNDGKLDRPTFEQATTGFLAETGWCVAENVLARILSHVPLPGAPQASPLQLDAQSAKAALAAIRATRYAGVTFKPAASAP